MNALNGAMKENKPWWEMPPQGKNPFNWRNLSEVKSVPVEWLWKPYIPRGAATLIAGDGGYGKSWMTCAIAADLSQGRSLPGQQPMAPQKVLMISAEDGLEQVTRPKMELLDANMENIVCADVGFTIKPETRGHLAQMITQFDAAVVFLDPLVVYMGGKVDMFRANETREMMNMLVEVARHTNTALVAVHHVRKSTEGSVQNKVMGSADIVNGVRSVLVVDKSKGGQRYMEHAKSNWAANGPTLAYKFGSHGFEWQGHYVPDPDDKPEVSHTKRGEAADWMREVLSTGPMEAGAFKVASTRMGFTGGTYDRGRLEAKVEAFRQGARHMVRLPASVVEDMQLEVHEISMTDINTEGTDTPPGAPAVSALPQEDVRDKVARILAGMGKQ